MVFYKYHSLGNDFIIAEWLSSEGNLEECSVRDVVAARVARCCNRHTGIGADGVIFVIPVNNVWHAYVFNSDGSYGEFSGNGVRCVAWFLMTHKKVTSPLSVVMGGSTIHLEHETNQNHEARITTSVALPQYHGSVELTVEGEVLIGHIVIGANPHLIIERKTEDITWLQKHGAALEYYKGDGSRINVECIWQKDSASYDDMNMRVFERGAGITQACSSGVIACHFFLTHFKKVLLEQNVAWHNLGGTVFAVSFLDHIKITAPATFVFQGVLL